MNKMEYYNYFKKNFNIDLESMSEEEAKKAIDKINEELEKKLLEEEKKREKIINEYNNIITEYNNLKNKLQEIQKEQ